MSVAAISGGTLGAVGAHRDRDWAFLDTDRDWLRPRPTRPAALAARSASAIGLRLILPSVPSRRGAEANSVANTACTASTTPTCATNRRDPVTFPSSTPQNTFKRALTRSTAVRPLYIRSNFFVARGSDGNRLGSTSRGTRTVLPYDLPALQIRRHRALPALVLRRAAVLQRLALGLVPDVGHLVSHRRIAHLIITIDRPVFRVHHVRACRRGPAASAPAPSATGPASGSAA